MPLPDHCTFSCFTDAGCFLLVDPVAGLHVDESFLFSLNHVCDPDGRTHLVNDYPSGTWREVWESHCQILRHRAGKQQFTLILCDEGEWCFSLAPGGPGLPGESRAGRSYTEYVYCPHGSLAVIEGMDLFSGWLDLEDPLAVVQVPEGLVEVTIREITPQEGVLVIEGVYGTVDSPALEIGTKSASSRRLAPWHFPRCGLKVARQPGVICGARIVGIEGDTARLELRLTESTWRGFARMRSSSGDGLNAGDSINVRLLEDRGAFWIVELFSRRKPR